MFNEYAIDPEAVLDMKDLHFLRQAIGLQTGRLLADLPTGWARQIQERVEQPKNKKRTRMMTQIAHFPLKRDLDDFDFSLQPSIDPKLIRELDAGRYIANGENILFLGPPGVDKTHLAIGLGRKACAQGNSCLFVPAMGLVSQHIHSEADGRLEERLAHLTKPAVLSIDEVG